MAGKEPELEDTTLVVISLWYGWLVCVSAGARWGKPWSEEEKERI